MKQELDIDGRRDNFREIHEEETQYREYTKFANQYIRYNVDISFVGN